MMIIKLLHSQLLFLMVGGFVQCILWGRRRKSFSITEWLGLSYLLGAGCLGIILFILCFFGVYITHSIAAIISIFCGFAWLSMRLSLLKKLINNPDDFRRNFFKFFKSFCKWTPFQILLLTIIFLLILVQLQYVFQLPLLGYDSRAHWGFKARILHYEGTIYSDSFFDPERIHPQVKHPLLMPVIGAVMTLSNGSFDDRLLKFSMFMMLLASLLIFYSEMRLYYSRTPALGFSLFMLCIPQLITSTDGGIISGYSDAPLALYFLAFIIYLARWRRDGKKENLAIATLLALCAMHIKDDGLGCVAAAGFALFVSALFSVEWKWKKRIPVLIVFCVLALLVLLPSRIFSRNLSVVKGEHLEGLLNAEHILSNIERVGVIFSSYFLEMFFNLSHWGLLWIFFLSGILFNWRHFKNRVILFVALTFFAYLGVLTIVFIILPWDLEQFFAGSLSRLILHLAPLAVYLIALLWNEHDLIKSVEPDL
jgi:hypothetical protein